MPSASSGSRTKTPHVKINPFYISRDEDDGAHDWGEWSDDHDEAERSELIALGGQHPDCPPRYGRRKNGTGPITTIHDQGEPYDVPRDQSRTHTPQFWKYGLLAGIIFLVVVVVSKEPTDGAAPSGGDFVSLIDEIPDDEMRLVLLGERHSGVPWMQSRLQECFPRAHVSSLLQRNGHFFQDDETSSHIRLHDIIVVHMTVNVYDWLEQMRLSPEYSPNHVAKHQEGGHMVPLEWKEFVTKPWTMPRPERDTMLLEDPNRLDGDGPVCQLDFQYHQVVSCVEHPLAGTDNPIYELDIDRGDETPYQSIIDLRAAKLRNHQDVRDWTKVRNLITVPYEHVGKDMKKVLREIQQSTGWQIACTGEVLPPSLDRSTDMTVEFVDYVTEHTDWEAEGLVPYQPWTVSDINAKEIQDEKEQIDTPSDASKSQPSSPSGRENGSGTNGNHESTEAVPTKPAESEVDNPTGDGPKKAERGVGNSSENSAKGHTHGKKEDPKDGVTASNSRKPGGKETKKSGTSQKAKKADKGTIKVSKNQDDKSRPKEETATERPENKDTIDGSKPEDTPPVGDGDVASKKDSTGNAIEKVKGVSKSDDKTKAESDGMNTDISKEDSDSGAD